MSIPSAALHTPEIGLKPNDDSCEANPMPKKSKGMTLVEVMVGTLLFTILGIGLTAGFIQNYRMSKLQTYRTQATATALSFIEQLRFIGYNDITANYNTATTFSNLNLLDPTTSTGYRYIALNINVKDGTQINDQWTETNLPLDSAANAPTLPVRFWLTLKNNSTKTTPARNVVEVGLIYQWQAPGVTINQWSSETLHLSIVNPNPQ